MLCVFFFSSRRRHTRYWRDWSSDVWLFRSSGKVYAIELHSEILQRATEYVARWGGGNCIVIGDDTRNLALHVHEPVAFALIANTFHGIPEAERNDLIQRVYNALKPADCCQSVLATHSSPLLSPRFAELLWARSAA